MTNSSRLEDFDFFHLLRMLSDGGKTGVLTIQREGAQRDPDTFEVWLTQGRIVLLRLTNKNGDAALGTDTLRSLLAHPRGRFYFEEGQQAPSTLTSSTPMDASVDDLLLDVIDALPELPLPFEGPARITSAERLAQIHWTTEEERILRQIENQVPLSQLATTPLARSLISRLGRLSLLRPRKSRVARLTVGLTHEVRGVVLIDELIFRRWRDDLGRPPQRLAIRAEDGEVYALPVREGPNLGTSLMLPPDVIMTTRLRVGESVLVQPV